MRFLNEDDLPRKGNYDVIKTESVEYNNMDEREAMYMEQEEEDRGKPLTPKLAREFGYILISFSNYGKNVVEGKRKQFKYVRLESHEASSKLSHPFYDKNPEYIKTYYNESGSGYIDTHIYQLLSDKKTEIKLRDQNHLPVDIEF